MNKFFFDLYLIFSAFPSEYLLCHRVMEPLVLHLQERASYVYRQAQAPFFRYRQEAPPRTSPIAPAY
jgi:hypothetical protein